MGKFGVVAKEGAGAQQHGAAPVIGQFRDHPVMEGRGIEKNPATGQKGQQSPGGEPQGMEEGQSVKEMVVHRHVIDGADLGDIGQQSPMGQFHPLGATLGTGGEQHHRRVFPPGPIDGTAGPPQGEAVEPGQVVPAQFLAQVFQIEESHPGEGGSGFLQVGGGEETAGGNDEADGGGLAGHLEPFPTGAVIKHSGHPAHGGQAQEQAQGGCHIGQQHPHPFRRSGAPGQETAQHQAHF